MDCETIMRWAVWVGLLCGCPAAGDVPEDTDAATEAATSDGHACHPGSTLDCACSNGAMGAQACAADGQSYGACECGGSESSTGGSSDASAMTDDSGEATDATAGGETTVAESSSSGQDTTGAECEPGEVVECDCGSGPGAAVCSDGQLGACECCMGSHPLVEGDLRYCEAGSCYCGDLSMKPPLDACYAEAIADPCCPVELECY